MTKNTFADLTEAERRHPLAYLFPPEPYSFKRRRLIRAFLRQDGVCFYCMEDMAPIPGRWDGDDPLCMTADHLVPAVCGGTWAESNIVASCLSCNKAKKAMSAEKFVPPQKQSQGDRTAPATRQEVA